MTIKQLLEASRDSTVINIKRSDNGKVVIHNVHALANSKDNRQIAKWGEFQDIDVFGITPSMDVQSFKRHGGDVICLTIDAYITPMDYEQAINCDYADDRDGGAYYDHINPFGG